jgi:very-short-patch-repair endonuclease
MTKLPPGPNIAMADALFCGVFGMKRKPMSKGNTIIYPQDMPGASVPAKPRAARGTGEWSQRKAKARCETQFLLRWQGPAYVTEHRFHPTKRWRFDYAWPDAKVALEIEGGIFTRGAHVRPRGIADDIDKANAAAHLGWRLFRACDLSDLDTTIAQIMAALATATPTAASAPHAPASDTPDASACEPAGKKPSFFSKWEKVIKETKR